MNNENTTTKLDIKKTILVGLGFFYCCNRLGAIQRSSTYISKRYIRRGSNQINS